MVLVLVEVEVEVEVEEATMTARTKKAKQGLEPGFRKRFGALPRRALTRESGPGPRARRPQQAWRATEPGPALASVEFILAERTTESYQKMQTLAPTETSPTEAQNENEISR